MRRTEAVIGILVMILLGASALAARDRIDVKTDGTGNFAGYQTYAWKPGAPAQNPKMQDLIVDRVEAQLTSKGLERAETEPDLLVVTYVLPDKVTDVDLTDSGLEFWSGITSVSPTDTGAGTLVVDLIDAGTDDVVWRGIARETVKGSFKRMERKVGLAIEKMFRRYPPR